MLTETVATIASSSERSVQSLEEIKNNLLHASELQDLCKIKDRLGICLEQVRQESARHREDTQKTIQDLETCIRRAEDHTPPDASADPVTKLPGREAAQAMVKRVAAETGRKYMTVMVFDRIQSVNARFGYEAGNQILAALARYVETKLQPTDTLFRWSGPTLVAIMQRQVTIDRIRDDLRPVFSNPIGTTVDIGSRDVMIPISPAWAVFGILPSVETTLKAVEAFVASQVPKEYV
jgi:GGDEF domain-containing protein